MENRNNFYTLEEKLELYIAALDYLRLNAFGENYKGLCAAIDVAINKFKYKYSSRSVCMFSDNHPMWRSPLPELLVFMPKSLVFSTGEPGGLFWFPLDEEGNNRRVEILELIIKNLQDGRVLYERAEA